MVRRRTEILIVILDLVLIVGAAFAENIASLMLKDLPDCYFAAHSIPCPACGGTRCVYNFFSFNFATAFSYNQFMFLLIIYVIVITALLNLGHLFKIGWAKNAFKRVTHYEVIIALAVAYALFGVIRTFL